jgi:uncharacterized BrkB/YihY/UPF0761 family membrane protein
MEHDNHVGVLIFQLNHFLSRMFHVKHSHQVKQRKQISITILLLFTLTSTACIKVNVSLTNATAVPANAVSTQPIVINVRQATPPVATPSLTPFRYATLPPTRAPGQEPYRPDMPPRLAPTPR